jgi:hypothetical protein
MKYVSVSVSVYAYVIFKKGAKEYYYYLIQNRKFGLILILTLCCYYYHHYYYYCRTKYVFTVDKQSLDSI